MTLVGKSFSGSARIGANNAIQTELNGSFTYYSGYFNTNMTISFDSELVCGIYKVTLTFIGDIKGTFSGVATVKGNKIAIDFVRELEKEYDDWWSFEELSLVVKHHLTGRFDKCGLHLDFTGEVDVNFDSFIDGIDSHLILKISESGFFDLKRKCCC